MLDHLTIRKKLLVAMIVLGVAVFVVSYSGFRGVFAYRDLAATVSYRANELPITTELTQAVDNLRYSFRNLHPTISVMEQPDFLEKRQIWSDYNFRQGLREVTDILTKYNAQLQSSALEDPLLSDRSEEQRMVTKISRLIENIAQRHRVSAILDPIETLMQRDDLEELHTLTRRLPTFLQNRMASFRVDVRSRYRTWIVLTVSSTLFAAGLLVALVIYTRKSVILPFKDLLKGARTVASGQFDHRIEINSTDELAELAAVMNMATAEFLKIQQDLHDQVRERSREVIRNEQLASVGFLAAGVAHEINNPLASIAWSAEALESRLHNILHGNSDSPSDTNNLDLDVLRNYLRCIQDEAFRCKGITERLLDFSRLGNAERKQYTDMTEIVQDVIAMVRHLGQYRSRKIDFTFTEDAVAWASPQEMKQVVLNLITNAMDAIPPEKSDGTVTIRLTADSHWVKLSIEDNGCGMTDEVLEHLFEPFFTRRRDGRGTGLGLPITSRIIADHGGRITPSTLGVNLGSRFDIQIPRNKSDEKNESIYQAAAA